MSQIEGSHPMRCGKQSNSRYALRQRRLFFLPFVTFFNGKSAKADSSFFQKEMGEFDDNIVRT